MPTGPRGWEPGRPANGGGRGPPRPGGGGERRRAQRGGEGLRRALEGAVEGDRRLELGLYFLNLLHRLAQRHARRQVERYGDGGELALVVDGERGRLVAELRHRADRDLRAVPARHVDTRQRRRVGLERRRHFEHDLVLGARRIDRRHLALAEGVVQRLVALAARRPGPRAAVAVGVVG